MALGALVHAGADLAAISETIGSPRLAESYVTGGDVYVFEPIDRQLENPIPNIRRNVDQSREEGPPPVGARHSSPPPTAQ